MAVGQGNATTVVFGTTTFAMVITAIDSYALSRDSVETSNMGTTTNKTFIPMDLSDLGEMTVSGHHSGSLSPPINAVPELITVDWAGDGGTYASDGFMTGYTAGAPMGDMMTGQYTIKFTG